MNRIVFATVKELFDELRERGQSLARVETVATTKTDGKTKLRYTIFEIYVTAQIEGNVGIVVIPYHQTYSGLVKHEEKVIDEKEYNLLSKIKKMAKDDIKLLSGAYWNEKPFFGAVELEKRLPHWDSSRKMVDLR